MVLSIKKYVKKLRGGAGATLAGTIGALDALEALLACALECYRAAVDSMAEHAPESPRGLREEHRKRLKQIRTQLLSPPSTDLLAQVRKQIDAALSSYAKGLNAYVSRQENETKQILSIMATLAESMAARDQQHNVRFRAIAKKLRLLTTSQDLSQIRLHLVEEVDQLEKYVEEMSRDTRAAVERLRAELQSHAQASRAEPWLEPLDEVTGLGGRPELATAIEARKRTDARFCLVRFYLDRFDQLRSRLSKSVLDGFLRQFAEKLKGSVGEAAVVGRWDEDEFLAVIDAPLPELAMRTSEWERRLSGGYTAPRPDGGGERVVISCFVGVVESLRGESAEQMIARLQAAAGAGVRG